MRRRRRAGARERGMLVAGHLSQAEVDALLQSLRAGQAGSGDAAAPPAPAGAALPDTLARLLSAAWGRQVPELALRPAAQASQAARGSVSHVTRLGAPLGQRVWCWGDGRQHAALAEDFVQRLGALLSVADGPHPLGPETPFPADGILMTFEGEGSGVVVTVTLGLEPAGAARIAARLSATRSGAAWAGGAPAVPLQEIEVEATVYVGGGMYRLSQLATLRPGTILPLSTEVGEPAVIAIGDRVIAFGEIVVTPEETVAVRLTRVVLGEEGRAAAPGWLEQGPAPADRLGAGPPPERGRSPLD